MALAPRWVVAASVLALSACAEGGLVDQEAFDALVGAGPSGGAVGGTGGQSSGGLPGAGGLAATGGASGGVAAGGTGGLSAGGLSAGGLSAGGVAAGGSTGVGGAGGATGGSTGAGGSTVAIPLGTCDFASAACSTKTCASACGSGPNAAYCTTSCQAIIECVKPSNGGCVTTDDPLCGAYTGGTADICTQQANNGSYMNQTGTGAPGTGAGAAIEIVQCACASTGSAGAAG